MSDLINEERNEKIRKQWLEQIDLNERVFAKQLKKENLPFEKFLEIEKFQRKGQELKKRIEDGYVPEEPPSRGYKPVDGTLIPMTEEESDELEKKMENPEECAKTIDPLDSNYDKKSQPKPEIQKQKKGSNKLIGKICNLFSRK